MLFFGILRKTIYTLFTILGHVFTLWKWDEKRLIFGVSFGSRSRVPPERAKMHHETPQMRNEVEKGSQNGSLLAWKNRGKGWYKHLEGSFLNLPMVWCAFAMHLNQFDLFSDLENGPFTTKSDLFLRPVVAYVQRLWTWEKKTRVPPCISCLRVSSQMPAERVSPL